MTFPGFRKIIHVDMDAFFASVEQRDNPDLRGKPVAVGGSSLRGVVAAASYEARVFGVHSAMPSVTARRKCPDLIFVKSRFDVYRDVSRQIRDIFSEYTPLVEPLSLDEAYLDVTDRLESFGTATNVAKDIQAKILSSTGLTASAGVSYNKFLAKVASGLRKPHGLSVITPNDAERFIAALPVEKFHGIGPATAAKMHGLNIRTGADLRDKEEDFLERHFGKSGKYYHAIARGIDERTVQPDRIRKSAGAERTFHQDIHSYDEAITMIRPNIDKVWDYCTSTGRFGKTLTLKVKFSDFTVTGRSHTLPLGFCKKSDVEQEAFRLLKPIFPADKGVRLLGIKVSSFEEIEPSGFRQTSLF